MIKSEKPKIALLTPRYGLVDRGVEVFTKELITRLKGDFCLAVFSRVKSGEAKKVFSLSEEAAFLKWVYKLHPWLSKKLDKYFLNPLSIEMLSFSIFAFPKLLFGDYGLLFPQNGVWGAITCRLIRIIKKTPFIYATHGGVEPPILRQKPNLCIATSPKTYEWINKDFPKVKTVLVPLGINLEMFSPRTQPVVLNLEKPIFLCVASLIPTKGIDLAIKAVASLEKGSLLVLGDGPLEEELTKLGERLLGKRRFSLIQAPYEKMPQFYTACDVFTLPSKDEPFGIAYLEALASGLPVVAPDDKSRRYIVGSAGVLCRTENLKEYAQALKKAAELDFSDRPQKQAEKFSWEKIGKRYKAEIERLLN